MADAPSLPLTSRALLAAIALPIVGAIKAFDGVYYRYPVVGVGPA